MPPTAHISHSDLRRYHADTVPEGPELAAIEEHLLWCPVWLGRVEECLRGLGCLADEHIETEELECYQLGRLDTERKLGVAEHLSECRECSSRLFAVERFIELLKTGVIRGGLDGEFR